MGLCGSIVVCVSVWVHIFVSERVCVCVKESVREKESECVRESV